MDTSLLDYPTRSRLPEILADKVGALPETSYGATVIALVLTDGRRIENVHVAWGRDVIKAERHEDDVLLSQLDPQEIVDVIPT